MATSPYVSNCLFDDFLPVPPKPKLSESHPDKKELNIAIILIMKMVIQ